MRIHLLPSARGDLAEGEAFYEAQGEGLGAYFLELLFSDIDSLKLYAGTHRKVFGLHRLLSKRFPFGIYHSAEPGAVFVKAILDCRQDSRGIKLRFKNS